MKINLKNIPQKPGVYLFKDKKDNILYIGKATSLKSRVSSYFHKSSGLTPHKQLMVKRITKVQYIITSSTTEALLLESQLIKKHQPPYNVDLKDDKNFQFIKISLDEEFPRVFTARRILKDKAKYFGPFVSGGSVRQTLHLLRKLFPHRNFPKPVSDHHLKFLLKRYPQLMGPQDKEEYQQTIKRIISFLKGGYDDIVNQLKQKMNDSSRQQQYELAAAYRNKIQAIERLMEKQKVISTKLENQDLISLARENDISAINLFMVRQGKLINKQNFILKNTADQTDSEIVQSFIERYYSQNPNPPRQLLIPDKIDNKTNIEQAFKLKVIVPQKGTKKQYLNLGQENAADYLNQQQASWQKDEIKTKAALDQFKKLLKLKKNPERIEIFDISNIQGQTAVGSMVVFTDGQPDKKWYRKFKIKTIKGANDPAMMAEILSRRFQHISDAKKAKWPKPDLVILDGGKGQLNTVLQIMPKNIPTVAIAKRQEDIYLPDKKEPVNFPTDSEALFLIQRMRDEAHRFAITFFRKKHQLKTKKSQLDDIPGLGPKTKKLLKKNYGTIDNIKKASDKELAKLVGNSRAKLIRQNL